MGLDFFLPPNNFLLPSGIWPMKLFDPDNDNIAQSIVRSRYLAVTVLQIIHERHPMLAREGKVWVSFVSLKCPKFYLRNCCAVCNNELYCTENYHECVVLEQILEWGQILNSQMAPHISSQQMSYGVLNSLNTVMLICVSKLDYHRFR